MSLLEQLLAARNYRSNILRNLDLVACEALKEDYLLSSLQPSLDNFHSQMIDMLVISFTCDAVCDCFSIVSKDPNLNHISRL